MDTPLTLPENNQNQRKSGHKFTTRDRDNFYDWYNAYFRINFTFEATTNGARIGANTESAPVNGSFSLIKSLTVKSAGKSVYEANDIHKVIFIKNLLDFSDDYSRSMAKNQFWYLDNDATTVTSDAATNLGMRHRAVLSYEGIKVETILPLNRYPLFEGLSDRLLPSMQLEFEIVLQDYTEMIFQSDGTARRIVVRKFELWIPRLQFTGEGQKLVKENFLNCISKDLIQDDLFPPGTIIS